MPGRGITGIEFFFLNAGDIPRLPSLQGRDEPAANHVFDPPGGDITGNFHLAVLGRI